MAREVISVYQGGKLLLKHSYRDTPLLGLTQTKREINTSMKPVLSRILAQNPKNVGEVRVDFARPQYAFSITPRSRLQYVVTNVRGQRWPNVERTIAQLADWVKFHGSNSSMTRAQRSAANKAAFAASRKG